MSSGAFSPPLLQSSHLSSPRPANVRPSSPVLASPRQRKQMSLMQTYSLAHKARAKLAREAARSDHDLRLLVGHANLLDSLMVELADAEREQESWFNHSVRNASQRASAGSKARHVQWADTVVEEPEEDWRAEDAADDSESDASDSDSDDGSDAEDVIMADAIPLTKVAATTTAMEIEAELDEDDEEDYAALTLQRSPSRSPAVAPLSPPELDHDSDSSEDESMPPSPPTVIVQSFDAHDSKKGHKNHSADFEEHKDEENQSAFFAGHHDAGFYIPPRNPARLVSAISVY